MSYSSCWHRAALYGCNLMSCCSTPDFNKALITCSSSTRIWQVKVLRRQAVITNKGVPVRSRSIYYYRLILWSHRRRREGTEEQTGEEVGNELIWDKEEGSERSASGSNVFSMLGTVFVCKWVNDHIHHPRDFHGSSALCVCMYDMTRTWIHSPSYRKLYIQWCPTTDALMCPRCVKDE